MDGGISALKQVGANNAEIVVGDMREGRSAFHVAQRVDAGHVGLQPFVHPDEAAFVHLDSACRQIEPVGIGNTSRGQKQM